MHLVVNSIIDSLNVSFSTPFSPSHPPTLTQGTSVKAIVVAYDAKGKNLTAKDAEGNTLAAVGTWASKDAFAGSENKIAFAGLEDDRNVGSAGVIAPSGYAYVTQLYGPF
jgi:hypothetical protein